MKKKLINETKKLNILLAVLIIIVIGIVFLLNMIGRNLSEHYPLSADLTANSNYDIGDDSKAVLESLTDDINIYVMATKGSFSGNSYLVQVRKILEQYPKHSPHVKLDYIDYTSDPTFAAKYPDLDLSSGDVIIVGPQMVKQLPLANMFNYTYDAAGNLTVTSSRAEEAITSGIVSAITVDPINVGVLTGNGVSNDRSTLKIILENNNFVYSELNMVTDSFDNMEVLLLLAPMQDLSEDVLSKLDAFLYNNGQYGRTLIYAADVSQGEMPNLDAFLREWGISVDDGAVFETSETAAYGYQPYYPIVDYSDETFMKMLKDSSTKALMPLSRPLSVVFDFRDNRTVTELLAFSATSGVRPSNAGENFTPDQATRRGPMPAMLMSTMVVGTAKPSNVIVSASVQYFGSSCMGNTSISNAEYLTCVLNKLTERDDAISIEAKSLAGNVLAINTASASMWGIILCIIVPVGILTAGIIVFLRRRYR
ncbi:MAG: Gldg family protein [Lachnospiraceae bacterium]|nr:Gldg family protein [Lachnospiraceae bacterium]